MKNGIKAFPALLLALCLLLTGCSGREEKLRELTEEDAILYVTGVLKEFYLGEFDPDYLELVGIDEHEAEHAFENSLGVEAQYFISLYGIDEPTEELYEELQEMYREIYSHARFQVLSATREEDGSFSVTVEIEPIDIIRESNTPLTQALAPWYEKYPKEVQSTMTTEEWEAADQEWSRIIVDTVKERLPQLGHMEAKQVTVKLAQEEDGFYTLSNEDFSLLNDLIIDYSKPETPEETPEPTPTPTPEATPEPTTTPESPRPTSSPDPNAVEPPTTASPLPLPSPDGTAEPSPAPTE